MNVVLLTNILTPYRRFFYDKLYEEFLNCNCEFHVVVMASTEKGRNWSYDKYKTDYTVLLNHISLHFNVAEIHLNSGLKKLYKKLCPDIVICGGSYLLPAVWATIIFKKQLNYKVWYWSESHLSETRQYGQNALKIRDFLRNQIYKNFDGFWFAGRFSKKFIERYASEYAKYIFVPNLVDNLQFGAVPSIKQQKKIIIKKAYQIPLDKKVLFTPARLTGVKGICEFLELYCKAANHNNAIYLIAGEGELFEKIVSFCAEKGLDVKLLGYKTEIEIIDLYAITDIFVLPSLSDPNPLSCVEACWSELPLLVSEHVGNYPEIVHEGDNGFVFSYKRKTDAIDDINRVISKEEAWFQKAGQISRAIAEDIYNPNTVVKRIVNELTKNAINFG